MLFKWTCNYSELLLNRNLLLHTTPCNTVTTRQTAKYNIRIKIKVTDFRTLKHDTLVTTR